MEKQRKIVESKLPPANREVWWFDPNKEELKRYKGGSWVEVSPSKESDEPVDEDAIDLGALYEEYNTYMVDYVTEQSDLDPEGYATYDESPTTELAKFWYSALVNKGPIKVKISPEIIEKIKACMSFDIVDEVGDSYMDDIYNYSIEDGIITSERVVSLNLKETERTIDGGAPIYAYSGVIVANSALYSISIDVAYKEIDALYNNYPYEDAGNPNAFADNPLHINPNITIQPYV